MNVKNFSLVLAIMAMSVSSVSAQNFFWSTLDFGQGAVNGDLTIDAEVGDTGTVFLYYNDNGQSITEGIDLNFGWDVTGVAGFTAAETFEADILLGDNGPDLDDRWGDAFGPAGDVTQDTVSGFITVNVVNGTGIQVENIPGNLNGQGFDFIDTLYDQSASAFQVGSFSYEALANGTASITDNEISGLVVDGGADIGAAFNSVTVNVGAAIPEPTSAGILACGLFGLVARRRR